MTCRTRSPRAWPWRSLTRLKLLRSIRRNACFLPSERDEAATAAKALSIERRFARFVREIARCPPPELSQLSFCGDLAGSITPLSVQPTNDKSDDTKRQQDREEDGFCKRYLALRL